MIMPDAYTTFLENVETELTNDMVLSAMTTKALKFYRNYFKRQLSDVLFVSVIEKPLAEGEGEEKSKEEIDALQQEEKQKLICQLKELKNSMINADNFHIVFTDVKEGPTMFNIIAD